MKIALLLLLVLPSYAATIPLTVGAISPSQGVVSYTNTGLSGCSYTATAAGPGGTYTADTSALTVQAVSSVTYVHFGTGVAEAALPANTLITVGVSCNSGTNTGTTTFTTHSLPIGNTYTTPAPYNSSKFGNYDWPVIDWSNQSKQYVDPQTGVLIKRMTTPGWWGAMRPKTNYTFWGGGTGWTNPQNALLGAGCTSGTSSDCAVTGNTNKLFVAMGNWGGIGTGNGSISAGFSTNTTQDDFIVFLNGLGTDSTASNREVSVCLSYFDSGATCSTASHTVQFGTGSVSTKGFPAATMSAWASTAAFNFAEWGGTAPDRNDFASPFGTVQVTGGGTTVTLVSQDNSYNFFNTKWNNAQIYIKGCGGTDGGSTDISILSGHPASPEVLTLQNACPNVQGGTNLVADAGFGGSVAHTDLVVDSVDNKKVTSALHTFVAGDVGALLYINGGPGWTTGYFAIASVTGGAAVLNASPAALNATSGDYVTGQGRVSSATRNFGSGDVGNTINITSGTGWTVGSYNILYGSGTWATLSPSSATVGSTGGVWQIVTSYKAMAAGVVVSKTNTNGTVAFGAEFAWAFSPIMTLLAEGDQQICNPNPVSVGFEADGSTPIIPSIPGNICYIAYGSNDDMPTAAGYLWLLIPSRGETRLLSPLFTSHGDNPSDPAGDQNTQAMAFRVNSWDATDGTIIYGTSLVTGGKLSIFRGQYDTSKNWKAYSHPYYACGDCGPGSSALVPGESTSGDRWSDDPMIYTNITPATHVPSLDVATQITTSNPLYDATIYTNLVLDRVVGGYAVFSSTVGNADGACLVNVFNLSTGLFSGYGDSFSTYPVRWGGCHTDFQSLPGGGYFSLATNPPGGVSGFAPNSNISLWGPFIITPHSVLKSASFNTNTSLTPTSPMDACPANSYGATGNNCMSLRTAQVCSHSPSTPELAKWVCPTNPAWSQPQKLAPGDAVIVSPTSEIMQVLSVAPASETGCTTDCAELVLARARFGSNAGTSSTGWSSYAIPPNGNCDIVGCAPGIGAWTPITAPNLNAAWISDPTVFSAHVVVDAAPTVGSTTTVLAGTVGSPYKTRYNSPLPSQAGTFVGANLITGTAPFRSVDPSETVQSYPSNEQIAANSSEKNWFLDYHSFNGSLGLSGSEHRLGIEAVTYTLMAGTTGVYEFTVPGGALSLTRTNYKIRPPSSYAGRWNLKDISSPTTYPVSGGSITDATPFKYCIALATDECVHGGVAGRGYVSVPNVPTSPTSIGQFCYVTWLTENAPCLMFPATMMAQLVQVDASQAYSNYEHIRTVTMGLTGPGRQYQFSSFIPESTGKWGMFKVDWADGQRMEIFGASMPAWFDDSATIARNNYVPVAVAVTGGTGLTARLRIGYTDYGTPSQGYCTARQEACFSSGSAGTAAPVYAAESQVPVACDPNCTISAPLVPGKIAWVQPVLSDSSTGPLKAIGEPNPAPDACVDLAVSPTSSSTIAGGAAVGLTWTVTDPSCSYTVLSGAAHITITAASGGCTLSTGTGVCTSNGTVTATVAANVGVSRTGTVFSSSGPTPTWTDTQASGAAVSPGTVFRGAAATRGVVVRK